ncbi:MAG: hypothetical protein NTV44_01575 [Firmicutes bacterium]|nr:hypothetical protein [Bacillota bacterium]
MEKEAVLKMLKQKRRQLQEEIWRRDLFVGFGLLILFAIYLNLGYFGILPADRTLTGDVVTIISLILILAAGVGVCHYLSYRFFNKKYADDVEERIENQSGLFMRFLGRYSLSPDEEKKIEDTNRLGTIALTNESLIKTYYPESDSFMHNFVGFSSQKPSPEGFFTESRRDIIKRLSETPQYKYCLTQTENDVTLLIDGFSCRYGDHLIGVFDDARFSRHLDLRKVIQTGVDVVTKTAHAE